MILTREIILSFRTKKGGFIHSVLKILGVSVPPREGWMSAIIGKHISVETACAIKRLNEAKEAKRKTPFGFDCVDGENLTPNTREQEAVSVIKELQANGETPSTIFGELSKRGIGNDETPPWEGPERFPIKVSDVTHGGKPVFQPMPADKDEMKQALVTYWQKTKTALSHCSDAELLQELKRRLEK